MPWARGCSKLQPFILQTYHQGRRQSANWGGGGIFIYSGSARLVSFEMKLISNEVSRAEPEYMNIHPLPPPPPPPQLAFQRRPCILHKSCLTQKFSLQPWIVKEMGRKLAGVSVDTGFAIGYVTSIENMLTVFGIFYILLYFSIQMVTLKPKLVLLFHKHAYATTNYLS